MRKKTDDTEDALFPPLAASPMGISWGLFTESGNPGYYMLYSDLMRLGEEEDDRFE